MVEMEAATIARLLTLIVHRPIEPPGPIPEQARPQGTARDGATVRRRWLFGRLHFRRVFRHASNWGTDMAARPTPSTSRTTPRLVLPLRTITTPSHSKTTPATNWTGVRGSQGHFEFRLRLAATRAV